MTAFHAMSSSSYALYSAAKSMSWKPRRKGQAESTAAVSGTAKRIDEAGLGTHVYRLDGARPECGVHRPHEPRHNDQQLGETRQIPIALVVVLEVVQPRRRIADGLCRESAGDVGASIGRGSGCGAGTLSQRN